MLISLIIFVLSLALVIKGADLFVDSAERIAKLVGISEFTIGLTLVAFATSVPELATGVMSALTNNTGIAAGTIIGSNITNIGLVLGISSLLIAIDLKKAIYQRDSLFLLAISVLFYVFALNGEITRVEGMALIALLAVFVYLIKKTAPLENEGKFERFLAQYYKPNKVATLKTYEKALEKGLNYSTYKKLMRDGINVKSMYREKLLADITKRCLIALFSMFVIYGAAKYLILSTVELAAAMSVPKEIIAISVIAFGTSVPELSVSLVAVKKKLGNILIGNVVGSCITNILLIGGITSIIRTIKISHFDIFFAMPIMILMVVFFVRYLQVKWFTRVLEGVVLLILYALFIISVIIFYLL